MDFQRSQDTNFKSALHRYGLALLFVAIVTAPGILFPGALETHIPYLAFYPAVTVAALFGGIGPGLFATLLSTLSSLYFFNQPLGHFSGSDAFGLLVFVINSSVISLVCEALLKARVRISNAELEPRLTAERRQAEETLRETKFRFDSLAEQTRTFIWEVDAEGLYTAISPVSEAVTGYRPEEIVGTLHFYDLHPESGRDQFKATAFEVFKRKEPFKDLKNCIQTKDGQIVWVSTNGVPLFNSDGTLKGYWGTDMDITDRKLSEIELSESEERLHAALEHSGEGVLIATDPTEIIYWNPAASAMHGFVGAREGHGPVKDLLKTFQLWTPDGSRQLPVDEWPIPRIVRGEKVQNLELRLRCPDRGWERLISHSGIMLRTASGEHLIFLFLFDLTAQRTAEAALLEADRKKDEFLAVLAHELRNPMAAISAAAEIMSRPGLNEDKVRFAKEALVRRVKQLGRLIDDLLDVSRIARGKIKLRKENLDLEIVIARATESSRNLFDERKQQLVVRVCDPLPVFGDPVRLEQIVTNLLTNASRYSNQGAETTLTALRDGPDAVVRVKDAGIGIPSSLLSRLFEPFMQAENSLERTRGGLGLGLAIVKKLCELHGGKVSVRSEGEGQGSEFEVRLPIGEAYTQNALAQQNKPAFRALKILIAEDHLDTATMMAAMYESEGHTIETAADGPSAVEKALSMKPDIILLDIGLPGFSGYEVAKQVRQAGLCDTLIIAVTGYGQEQDIKRAHEAGIDQHVLKPVDYQRLQTLFSLRERNSPALPTFDA